MGFPGSLMDCDIPQYMGVYSRYEPTGGLNIAQVRFILQESGGTLHVSHVKDDLQQQSLHLFGPFHPSVFHEHYYPESDTPSSLWQTNSLLFMGKSTSFQWPALQSQTVNVYQRINLHFFHGFPMVFPLIHHLLIANCQFTKGSLGALGIYAAKAQELLGNHSAGMSRLHPCEISVGRWFIPKTIQ